MKKVVQTRSGTSSLVNSCPNRRVLRRTQSVTSFNRHIATQLLQREQPGICQARVVTVDDRVHAHKIAQERHGREIQVVLEHQRPADLYNGPQVL